jgi:hypothetical protein
MLNRKKIIMMRILFKIITFFSPVIKSVKDNALQIKKTFFLFLKYCILLFTGALIYDLQRSYLMLENTSNDVLIVLISTIGITTAIIITFFFSKLYSDRNEKIQRKVRIDGLSKKLTAFRRIAHFLKSATEYWNFNMTKYHLDGKYRNMTLEDFLRSDLDQFTDFIEEIEGSELTIQAYLSLKEIEKPIISSYDFYRPIWLINYQLNDLSRYKDASERIWSFLDEYKSRIDASSINKLDRDNIVENLRVIYPERTEFELSNHTFYDLFPYFSGKILNELYYLTSLNSKALSSSLSSLLVDLISFICILISGVIMLSISINSYAKILLINVLVALFIISVVDLLINIIIAIRKEQNVDEYYNI